MPRLPREASPSLLQTARPSAFQKKIASTTAAVRARSAALLVLETPGPFSATSLGRSAEKYNLLACMTEELPQTDTCRTSDVDRVLAKFVDAVQGGLDTCTRPRGSAPVSPNPASAPQAAASGEAGVSASSGLCRRHSIPGLSSLTLWPAWCMMTLKLLGLRNHPGPAFLEHRYIALAPSCWGWRQSGISTRRFA